MLNRGNSLIKKAGQCCWQVTRKPCSHEIFGNLFCKGYSDLHLAQELLYLLEYSKLPCYVCRTAKRRIAALISMDAVSNLAPGSGEPMQVPGGPGR